MLMKNKSKCAHPECFNETYPGSGNFPYCSKSCRGKVDYQEKYKDYDTLLNGIKSNLRKQDKALEKANKVFPSKEGPLDLLTIFGYIDGVHSLKVRHPRTGQILQLYGKFAIGINNEKKTFIIYPHHEL